MAYGDLKVRNLIWNTGSGDNTVVLSTLATQSYVTTNFAPKANPTFTGTVTVPTASASDVSTKAASTAFVDAYYATKAAPAFTGSATGVNLTLSGNLTVNGTQTIINTQTLDVEDINITLGKVSTPSDTTANNGGITLKGSNDKTFNWLNATDAWTSSEHIEIVSGKAFRVNGNNVLNQTTLGSTVVSSSLTSLGTLTGLTVAGDMTLDNGTNAGKDITWDESANSLIFANEVKAQFGQTTLFHNSVDLYIQNGVGDIRLEPEAGAPGLWLHRDGSIELYDGNAAGTPQKKFETTATGVNVTGAITVNGSALSSAPQITATAYGTIAANAPVIVRSDGKVSTITGVSASFSSQANSGIALDLGSGSYSDNCHYFSADYDPTDNKICAAWYEDRGQNKLYAIIGTVSGTSVTWGSKVTVYSGESSAWIKCCWAQPGVVMVAYDRTNTTRARYISTSGNNGTLNSGGECTIIGYNSQYGDLKRTSNNGKCFVTYNHSQTGKAEIQQLYINGASISNSGGSNLDSSAYNQYARLHYAASKNAMIVTFLPNGGTYNGRGTVMLVANANTTSFTYKSSDKVYLNGGHNNDVQQPVPAWDPDNERMLIMYGNDSSGVPRSVEIGQITGSGSSVVPSMSGTRLDAGGDEANHETKFYYDSYKKKFIAAYKNVYDSKFMYRTYELNAALDGVTMSSAIVISSTGGLANNSYQTALEMVNISNAKWFTLFGIDSPAGGGTGQAYIQKRILDFGSTDLTTGNCIGFSSAGYSDGNTATINVVGNTITQSSLTAGQKYYVQSNGTLSTTADTPSVEAGIALSSTKLLIKG